MSKIFVDQVDPKTATTLTLGTTGDTITIPVGVVTSLDGAVTINDSSNDVDFTIEGNGDDDLFFVNGGTDRIGINAGATPEAKLHIIAAGASEPAAYFEQNSANDAMVLINNSRADDGSEISLKFNRADAVQGAIGTTGNGLNFWTGSSLGQRMSIDSTGDVGIGVASSDTKLKVNATVDAEWVMEMNHSDADNPIGVQIYYTGGAPDGSGDKFIRCLDTVAERFQVLSDGDCNNHDNSFGGISDERIKQNVRDANSQWDDIKALRVRNFKKKDDVRQYAENAWEQIGVVAQELESVGMDKLVKDCDPSVSDILSDSSFGTLVDDTNNPLTFYEDGDIIPEGKKIGDGKTFPKKIGTVNTKVKSVKYSVLYMKAIKALQESMERIEQLEAKVTALENA
jgi:hypothetical protein